MSSASAKLVAELAKLNPSGVVELFIIDASAVGGTVLYFYSGVKEASRPELPNAPITFQGQVYQPLPIQVTGFEFRSKGETPKPKIRMANVTGLLTSLVLLYDDLIGATLIRRRTLRSYLDDGSSPTNSEFPPDIFYFEQKTAENKQMVEFELSASIDLDGVNLPRGVVSANLCRWGYRSAECSFADNRFVATDTNVVYPLDFQITKYRGPFVFGAAYQAGDGVSIFASSEEEFFYMALQPVQGQPLTNTSFWKRVQHYRGLWAADKLYYQNDVVYVLGRNGSRMVFILTASTARGLSTQPPNLNYWQPDVCAKTMRACRMRHDPAGRNLGLPIGAYPGTSRTLLA